MNLIYACNRWDQVKHFFDFPSEISDLENNFKKLIEKQLDYNSGKNLWKSFLFYEKTACRLFELMRK